MMRLLMRLTVALVMALLLLVGAATAMAGANHDRPQVPPGPPQHVPHSAACVAHDALRISANGKGDTQADDIIPNEETNTAC